MKFTNQLIFLCIISFMGFTAHSQSLNFGVKVGANFSNISNVAEDNRLGLIGGAFANVKFNALALQTEVLFSQQGGEFDQEKIDTDYATVPVLLKLHFLKVFNVHAGPQFSYLLNHKDIVNSEQLDISGTAGIGLNLGSSLSLDARYNFGFTDVFENKNGKNRFISLAVGFSFL